ncbi:MAG: NAD(P)H-dependent oxidoreductase subunit E [Thermotogaceae bacterium]|nr:NAD(P)H-dependent oxidoreductase subunit E [Thermotogaceae bacterium]
MDKRYQALEAYMKEVNYDSSRLLNILHKAQQLFLWLPPDVLKFIAEKLNIPISRVAGVVSFYNFFSTKPVGRIQIKVCLGTACYVKGGDKVMERFLEELGLQEEGQVTEDGMFSVHAVRCVGACSMAPVVLIGENDFYGRMSPDKVPRLIKKYRQVAEKMKQEVGENA